MNGDVNPNANVMSNFGKQNFMQSGNGGGPDMYDLLPKDPLAPTKPKWLIESEQMHSKKQAQIQAEQDQFVPESFKQSGAMNLDIKGNKSQGKAKTWLDNNSNINKSNQQQSQPQNNYSNNNNNNNGYNGNNNYNNNNNMNNNNFGGNNQMNNNMDNNYNNGDNNGYGNNNNMNNGNNFGGNNNMNNNNMNNYGDNNNDFGGNNNGFGGNNSMNNNDNNNYGNNNNNNFPNNNNMNPQNDMNNGGYNGNNNNNNNMNKNQSQSNNYNNNQHQNQHQMNSHQKPMEQPVSQPYGNNQKADPFANMQYQRDFTNYGRPKQGKYQDLSKYVQSRSHQDTGNNNYVGPIASANKYQDMQAVCHYCKKPVGDKWTEDAKQRQYHDECFTCINCGAVLGQLGKYVTTGNGVVCKPCRNQQILAAQAAEQHY